MSLWGNPQGGHSSGGEGGGGTPSVVKWSDIRNKPEEFTPSQHTHVITEIKDLPETIEGLNKALENNAGRINVLVAETTDMKELLDMKVDKEEGKGLSTNDLTDEILDIIHDLQEQQGIEGVVSVNGQTGVVTLDKEDFGLSNVLDIKQASEEDFLLFKDYVERELAKKVDAESGKGLSSNDFTDEDKEKLKNLSEQQATGDVVSVNGKKGIVVLDNEDIGLGEVVNKKQATEEELNQLVNEVSKKVDKETDKELVEKDLIQLLQDFQDNGHVFSINGEQGIVEIDNVSIGLGEVENVRQASKLEHDALELRVNNHELALESKVDKDGNKVLSSNDFTDAHRMKLENLSLDPEFPENYVESINGKTGKIELTKEDVGLTNVLNEKQVTEPQLQQELENVNKKFDNYVPKEEGKGLSTNDFTDEDKEKLEKLVIGESPEPLVESVNGKTGKVELDKVDIGLPNVLNETQATLLQHQELSREVNSVKDELSTKVTSELGKGLSSNDFTDEYKQQLDDLPEKVISSVNGKTGEVNLTKEDLQLGLVDNIQQASKAEFDAHVGQSGLHVTQAMREQLLKVNEIADELETKVDKKLGYGLSSNDFTSNHKQIIETIQPQVQSLGNALDGHVNNDEIHVSQEERLLINTVPTLRTDINKNIEDIEENRRKVNEHITNESIHITEEDRENIGKVVDFANQIDLNKQAIDALEATQEEHINNLDIHLEHGERESIKLIPELQSEITDLSEASAEVWNQFSEYDTKFDKFSERTDLVETEVAKNTARIDHLTELIGENGEVVLPDGYIEELVKGHLYAFGNEVFDIINRNVIQGTLARRFALDNKDGLLSKENFKYNIIKVNGRDVFATGVDPDSEEDDLRYYEGLLEGVIQIEEDSFTQSVSANGEEIFNSSGIGVQLFGNTFELNIGMDDLDSETGELLKHASISMDFQLNLILPNDDFSMSSLSSVPFVTNNTFLFEDLHQHTVITKAELTYHEEFTNERVVFNNIFSNNTFVINKRAENGAQLDETIFSYVDKNAPAHTEHGIQLGLDAQTRDNYICDELLRKFDGVFDYIPERMEDPKRPIFNKATITHVLAMESDASPHVSENGELTEKLVAKQDTPLEEVAVRNTVIIDQDTDISNIPDGTLVFVKAGE